jgi:hypothetical protein
MPGSSIAVPGSSISMPGSSIAVPVSSICMPGSSIAKPGSSIPMDKKWSCLLRNYPGNEMHIIMSQKRQAEVYEFIYAWCKKDSKMTLADFTPRASGLR